MTFNAYNLITYIIIKHVKFRFDQELLSVFIHPYILDGNTKTLKFEIGMQYQLYVYTIVILIPKTLLIMRFNYIHLSK